MKIYFKLIYHLSYSESKNLCTWERERTEEFLLQKSQGQNRLGVRVENGGVGGWMTISTFSISYHLHLDSWVCKRWLIKIWRPTTP